MDNTKFLEQVAEIMATVPKGNSHTIEIKLSIKFDEMDGTAEQSAMIALEFLDEWADGHAFEMDATVIELK
jgi:hypothetical protein